MNRLHLESVVAAAWPGETWAGSHVLIAVSGGADSVALLRAVAALKRQAGGPGRVIVGHYHHGVRGSAAEADQVWVEGLAKQLGFECHVGRANAGELQSCGDGFEAAARQARYAFLTETAERLGARFVATAHIADDQVETVLHHVLRGTGLAGLAGIPRARPLSPSVSLIRPMLTLRRTDVLEYLSALQQDFRTDASNEDERFTRNRLRHALLPLLRTFHCDVDTALLRLATQAAEVQAWIGAEAGRIADRCVTIDSHKRVSVAIDRLADSPPFLVREVFKHLWILSGWPRQDMGHEEWQKLADLAMCATSPTAINLPAGVRAVRERGRIVMTRSSSIS